MPSRYGDQVAPVGALGRGERRGDDLEVDRVVGIGEDEQLVAAVGERILHAFLARRDQARRRLGIGEIDQPLLRGLVVAAGDHAKAAGRTLMQMGEPAGILLFINQRVVGLLGAQPMPPDLHRAMVVVELDVEEAVCSPCSRPRRHRSPRRGRRDRLPVAQSRTRIEKYSEPLVSALHACSLWSGECRALPNLKYSWSAASASPSSTISYVAAVARRAAGTVHAARPRRCQRT